MTPDADDRVVGAPTTRTDADASTRIAAMLRRWPTLAGLGFAALVALGMTSGTEMAAVLAAAAVVYLGTAALRRPRAAWPLFFATVVVITVCRLLDDRYEPTWVLLGAGIVLVGYGLVRGAISPSYEVPPLQTLALLGFGAIATVALLTNPVIGSYLVALGLLGHSAWDLYHHATNAVVVRSVAEFCFVLDAGLALAIVIVTATA
ncbi:MAG TPA: hypothetical protein VNP20_19920 [Nocardioidaceae bacterium]|nr:hypothetical protein [Nocardioidaceae bacterium]